jgi:hypothetical protein
MPGAKNALKAAPGAERIFYDSALSVYDSAESALS